MAKCRITISGSGHDTILTMDGKPVMRCAGFTVHGSPDKPTRVVLDLDPDEVEIAGNFEVETVTP